VSIQLTLSQLRGSQRQTLTSVEFKIRSGGDLVCESRKYTSPYPFAIWVKAWLKPGDRAWRNGKALMTAYKINLTGGSDTYQEDNSVVPKSNVDSIAAGIRPTIPCQLATAETSGPIVLSGNQLIDNVLTTTGDRILVNNQNNNSPNTSWKYNKIILPISIRYKQCMQKAIHGASFDFSSIFRSIKPDIFVTFKANVYTSMTIYLIGTAIAVNIFPMRN
jgi:hypothetical protein